MPGRPSAGGQAPQEGGKSRGVDLEDPEDRGEEVSPAKRTASARRALQGKEVCRWSGCKEDQREGCRLISFPHLLTGCTDFL